LAHIESSLPPYSQYKSQDIENCAQLPEIITGLFWRSISGPLTISPMEAGSIEIGHSYTNCLGCLAVLSFPASSSMWMRINLIFFFWSLNKDSTKPSTARGYSVHRDLITLGDLIEIVFLAKRL